MSTHTTDETQTPLCPKSLLLLHASDLTKFVVSGVVIDNRQSGDLQSLIG